MYQCVKPTVRVIVELTASRLGFLEDSCVRMEHLLANAIIIISLCIYTQSNLHLCMPNTMSIIIHYSLLSV